MTQYSQPTVFNFGRNVEFQPKEFFAPQSEQELLEILDAHASSRFRVCGRLHAWSEAAVGEEILIDLRHFNSVKVVSREESPCAEVGAGCQMKRVLIELEQQAGLTTPSVGLIDEQAIAGAISTGTHGSGKNSLSHYIRSVRVARIDETTKRATIEVVEQGEELRAARCSLGALGIIVSVTIECRPMYDVEEHWRRLQNLDEAIEHETEYPLQQFFLMPCLWQYFAQHRREAASPRTRLAPLYRIYWFLGIDIGLHLLLVLCYRILHSKLLVRILYKVILPFTLIRGWKVVDRAPRMLVMEHELFRHIETELFVPARHIRQAMDWLTLVLKHAAGDEESEQETAQLLNCLERADLLDQWNSVASNYMHHYPICVRKVLADDTLISMASDDSQDWYAISLISYESLDNREGFFATMSVLAALFAFEFGARPHWGKHCPLKPQELARLYPHYALFKEISRRFDPGRRFQNEWTEQLFGE